MDLFLPLISFILIAGGQGRQYANFADAATNMETLTAYWEAALPGSPVPPAIRDMLTQQNGLRKIGPNHETVNSEADHGGKHIHIVFQVDDSKKFYESHGEEDIKKVMMAHGPTTGKHLRRPSTSHGKHDLEKKIAVHRTKVEENPKEVLVPYGLEGDNTLKEVSVSYGVESEDILKEFPAHEENLKEVSVSNGLEGDEDLRKAPLKFRKMLAAYTPGKDEKLKEVSLSYASKGREIPKKVSGSYVLEGEKDLKEVSVSYGVDSEDILKELSAHEENLKEVSVSYGLEGDRNLMEVQQHLKKILAAYTPWKDEKLKEVSVSYGSKGEAIPKGNVSGSYGLEGEKDLKEVSVSYGVDGRDNLKDVSMSYGLEGKKDLKEVSVSYGVDGRENLNEVSVTYGSKGIPKEASESYGLKGENDVKTMRVSYRLDHEKILKGVSTSHEEKQKEVTMSYGSIEDKDEQPDVLNQVTEEGSQHVHARSYKNKKEADVFFFHDMLRPGSLITPTIPPTTSMPALLFGDVADSIPFSTEHVSEIITMFVPASLTMIREIRWTLDTCEHPRTLPGQKAGCATSLESLAELPASLLGRRNVRAFSAVDLPMDAPGTPALRGRYNVTAARKLSGSSSEVVTCHDLTYPYAVYYCHTSSPTAAYMVTLASMEEGASPVTMEVMAVCHLDTSLWSPKNPFFELHKVRPGDVAVCHFLTKLSIIWVSVDGHVDTL